MKKSDCKRMERFIDENYAYEYVLWTLAFDNENENGLRETDDLFYDDY